MLAPIISRVSLEYDFRRTYSERTHDLKTIGASNLAFTDADIEFVKNGNPHGDHIRFYKERWYEKPDHICFTIYELESNNVVCELHVLSAEKRMYWLKPIPRFTLPNLFVMLKITQDPNVRQIYSTSIYQ